MLRRRGIFEEGIMIFSDRQDSHDKRVDKILERGEIEPAVQTNFNLVGIRRRLNNIEMAAWAIVALLAVHVWRHW